MSTIAAVAVSCLKKLKVLLSSSELQHYDSEVRQSRWQDELGRLRVWAANIGAHQTGNLSLDYRLRDASHIKDQTLRVLKRLKRTLDDLQDTLDEPAIPDDFSGSEDEYETEIQLVYHALHDTINNLFQISMAIRRPAQHDRLSGTRRADTIVFEAFDKQHAANKYPNSDPVILERLGLAISQRRAILRYRERHSKKLGQGLGTVLDDQSETQSAKMSETIVTELCEQPNAQQGFDSQSVVSQSSYAQTLLHGSEGMVVPPPPANSADGAPFECPYCYRIISNVGKNSWARHVFLDLSPYICVFHHCPTPQRLYESRREWYFHLQSQHSVGSDPADGISCPLCLLSVPGGKQFQKHLACHLEELALFALPRREPEEDPHLSQAESEEAPPHDSITLSDGQSSHYKYYQLQGDADVDETRFEASESGSWELFEPENLDQSRSHDNPGTPSDDRLDGGYIGHRTSPKAHAIMMEETSPDGKVPQAARQGQEIDEGSTNKPQLDDSQELANIDGSHRPLPIKLKDAIGRKFAFPWELCRTWSV
ncbi:hypothetical protein N7457_006474 [Penicillium paradoxum]|uniref:uncharacterized protein n=1 Tax=Penicillium paradoxum TaxID=176176 RepID=UPI002548A738|nr:uncharacterized protein N7457_006474 [Penicillium paradoxum]KAJ5781314.1 hypothetical protein N7457_006474 [Penicillium paradoxum]